MRVLLSGGGSGGHIYPALAIARGLKKADHNVTFLYVGTSHGLESDLVPRENIPFRTIHARGLLVPGLAGKAAGAVTALRGLWDSLHILRTFKPDVVVGTGGYVSGPVGLAAGLLHIPLVIQEQNAWPGLTNRSLARRAAAVLVPFEEAVQYLPKGARVVLAGNPVEVPDMSVSRAEAREQLGLDPDVRLVMATGGSQGAEAVNRLMLNLLPSVLQEPAFGMIWATGKRYFQNVSRQIQRQYPQGLDPKRIQVVEYFYQIQTVLRASDLLVGRAGAMTLTDCQAFGVPMVLIPSPNVSEDHQTRNAEAVAHRGAGMVLKETELTERSDAVLGLLGDEERLSEMAAKVGDSFDAEALDRIVETIRQAARSSQGRKG